MIIKYGGHFLEIHEVRKGLWAFRLRFSGADWLSSETAITWYLHGRKLDFWEKERKKSTSNIEDSNKIVKSTLPLRDFECSIENTELLALDMPLDTSVTTSTE